MTRLARLISCAALIGLLAACGQGASEGEPVPPPTSAPADSTGGATGAPAAPGDDHASGAAADPAELAVALIGEMVAAYRAAPVLVSKSTLSTRISGQTRPDSQREIRFGPGPDILYETPYFRFYYVDRTIYVSYPNITDRYLRLPNVDNVFDVDEELGGLAARLVETRLRFGRSTDEIVQGFALGLTGTARISGCRDITDAEGRPFRQITLITVEGSASVNVDPQTHFIHSIETEEKLADAPVPNLAVSRRTVFTTTVLPSAAPITFDPGDRFATDSSEVLLGVGGVATLRGLKLVPGETAPDFVLHTVLGRRYVLSENTGRPLVLVFWASWDLKSRETIRQIGALLPWAKQHGLDVEVLGVCCMRRQTAEQDYWDQVVQFWDRETPPFETLIDQTDAVVRSFGVLGVPTTLVFDRDHRFVNAVGGFEEGSLEAIAQMVEQAGKANGSR